MTITIRLTNLMLHNYATVHEGALIEAESEKKQYSYDRPFKIFIASSILLRKSGLGKIIFLYGTSNAGKTSICREVMSINPNFIIDGIDAAMDRHFLSIVSRITSFKKYFFDRYLALSKHLDDRDIPSFLCGQKVKFKSPTKHKERVDVFKTASYVSIIEELFASAYHRDAAQDNLFERALFFSSKGKDVVIDTVDYNDFLGYKISKSFYCPLLVTLVHCSFAKLAEHKEKRNKLALQNKQEQETRFGTYPFLQFTDFLKPRLNNNEPVLHNINKGTVTEIYKRHLKEELFFRPIPGISEKDIQERTFFELGMLLNRLGLENNLHDEVQLTPRGFYDMEIDTGKYKPYQSALKILKFN